MLNHTQQNDIVQFLIKALDNVEESYMIQRYNYVIAGYQRPERVFTSELYHQLRLLQEDPNEISMGSLAFHVELNKQGFYNSQIKCMPQRQFRRLSPDIVLHKSQDNSSRKNQLLVCEIKMEGATWRKIYKDLQKLLVYKLSRLKFQNAVLIYTGSKTSFENKLQSILGDIELLKSDDTSFKCLKKHKVIIVLPKDKKGLNNCWSWEAYSISL